MKKVGVAVVIIFSIILLVFSSGCLEAKEEAGVCSAYDGNQEECLSHEECKWISDKNECDASDMDDIQGDASEELDVPDTTSNAICKQIPLSSELSPGMKYYCLAVVNNDVEFCEQIDEENEKNVCLAVVKKDSSYCKDISSASAKHVCYYQLAAINKNTDFCDDIDYSQHEKEQCYFNVVSNAYWFGKSNEITTEQCNFFEEPDRTTCLALKARDVSMCGSNVNCLTFFEQDVSFCDDKTLNECIRDRAMTSKDLSLCETLSGAERDNCIGDYCTHVQLDTAVCDKITDVGERQERYVELAIFLAKN